MDIKDFEGLTRYKLILPTIYVFSWICMLIGPTLFEATYIRICVFFLVYADIKVLVFFITTIIVCVKGNKVLNKYKNNETNFVGGQGNR